MFEVMFESMRKASESAFEMPREIFRKYVGGWPVMPMCTPVFTEPMKFQKKCADIVTDLVKKQQQTFQQQFSAGLKNIEEALHLGEAKNPEEVRARTVELWQKLFDCLRQAWEAQARDFQAAVSKWTELVTKGAA